MAPITYKSSARFELTSYSGLALVGECFAAAQLEALLDRHIPVSQGMRSSDHSSLTWLGPASALS